MPAALSRHSNQRVVVISLYPAALRGGGYSPTALARAIPARATFFTAVERLSSMALTAGEWLALCVAAAALL
jgi:hypothetical protein